MLPLGMYIWFYYLTKTTQFGLVFIAKLLHFQIQVMKDPLYFVVTLG